MSRSKWLYSIFALSFFAKFQAYTHQGRRKFEGFIVGGRVAKIEDFPHSAYLAIKCVKAKGEPDEFTCGSSILTQLILLTAAHCFENCQVGTKIIGCVGETNKHKRKLLDVSRFIMHPKYDEDEVENDIALAMLTDAITLNKRRQRVILPEVGIYDEPAMLAGWGITDEEHGTDSPILKTTKQVVMTRAQCKKYFPDLAKGFLCATGDSEDINETFGYAAVGDSGSALLVRGYVQIGIVSHKVADVSKSVIVYTDVSKYRKWIALATNALYCRVVEPSDTKKETVEKVDGAF